jgi:D-alanyl-lipoteichoic acid acyltransferase DltB (MBOAT superfamily)
MASKKVSCKRKQKARRGAITTTSIIITTFIIICSGVAKLRGNNKLWHLQL